MSDISNKFLKPNQEGWYYAQPSQIFHGLWTPYGIISPLMVGIWPDGAVGITYNMRRGAKFTKAQRRKIKYVTQRGVKLDISHIEVGGNDA